MSRPSVSERLSLNELLQKYAFENETVQAITVKEHKVSWKMSLGWVVHELKIDLG